MSMVTNGSIAPAVPGAGKKPNPFAKKPAGKGAAPAKGKAPPFGKKAAPAAGKKPAIDPGRLKSMVASINK